jgi:hypothetical protein
MQFQKKAATQTFSILASVPPTASGWAGIHQTARFTVEAFQSQGMAMFESRIKRLFPTNFFDKKRSYRSIVPIHPRKSREWANRVFAANANDPPEDFAEFDWVSG